MLVFLVKLLERTIYTEVPVKLFIFTKTSTKYQIKKVSDYIQKVWPELYKSFCIISLSWIVGTNFQIV